MNGPSREVAVRVRPARWLRAYCLAAAAAGCAGRIGGAADARAADDARAGDVPPALDAASPAGLDAASPENDAARQPADAPLGRDVAAGGATGTWTRICDNTIGDCHGGPAWSYMRGFMNVLPYDSHRHELIYLGAGLTDQSIYSNAIWGYTPSQGGVRGHMTLRVDSGVAGTQARNDCPNYYQVDSTYPAPLAEALTASPLAGHPMGNAAFDTTRNRLYMAGWLCNGQFEPRTHVYNSESGAMEASVPLNEYSPACEWSSALPHECDHGRTNQSWIYVPDAPSGHPVDRVLVGLSDGSGNRRMVEYDPAAQRYCVIGAGCPGADVTGADGLPCTSSTCPPTLLTSYGLVFDQVDHYVYVFGGCNGSSPGNGDPNPCSGTNQNDLWRYDAALRRFDRVRPAGDIKPPATNASNPFFAFDSNRNRMLFYAGTDSLWQYDVAANAWSETGATNAGPVITPYVAGHSGGNIAGFDPSSDTMVLMLPGTMGQAAPPSIWELHFGP